MSNRTTSVCFCQELYFKTRSLSTNVFLNIHHCKSENKKKKILDDEEEENSIKLAKGKLGHTKAPTH